MTAKDAYELEYWKSTDPIKHLRKYEMYLERWKFWHSHRKVIEIGTGPYSGFLPFVTAEHKVGVDPLYDAYKQAGIFLRYPGIQYRCSGLEDVKPSTGLQGFDALLCADCLDHGDLDFRMIPKLSALLIWGGKIYLHVHLRPKNKLNMAHDHAMLESDLDEALAKTTLKEVRREILPTDIDGKFCPALMAVWSKE